VDPVSSVRPAPATRRLLVLWLVAVLVAGCAQVLETAPAPTPADFPGIAGQLGQRGITVDAVVSGDAGCPDAELARTAIRFSASGLDQDAPVHVRVYIFRDSATYDRRRETVDACARSFITDPDGLQMMDASPFVIVGQGPWGPRFTTALRDGLRSAAGTP
jgi:hypothetical protein